MTRFFPLKFLLRPHRMASIERKGSKASVTNADEITVDSPSQPPAVSTMHAENEKTGDITEVSGKL